MSCVAEFQVQCLSFEAGMALSNSVVHEGRKDRLGPEFFLGDRDLLDPHNIDALAKHLHRVQKLFSFLLADFPLDVVHVSGDLCSSRREGLVVGTELLHYHRLRGEKILTHLKAKAPRACVSGSKPAGAA